MKQTVHTKKAPKAIGPYAQAIKIGNLVYTSGQIPILPETGELITGDIEGQARQVLENLKAVLEAAGSSIAHVVKTTVFIKNMDEFARINVIYGQYFADNPPARSCVEVTRLPKDVDIEIEAIAFID